MGPRIGGRSLLGVSEFSEAHEEAAVPVLGALLRVTESTQVAHIPSCPAALARARYGSAATKAAGSAVAAMWALGRMHDSASPALSGSGQSSWAHGLGGTCPGLSSRHT